MTEPGALHDWVIVHESASRQSTEERALVLQSAQLATRIHCENGLWQLLVMNAQEESARSELALYARESVQWVRPGPSPVQKTARHAILLPLAFLAALFLGYQVQTESWYGIDWVRAGAIDGGVGPLEEWWRMVLSMFLHTGLDHWVANAVFGGLFCWYLGKEIGLGSGALALVLCQISAAVVNALLRSPHSRAYGASMAVFAAVGMLGGLPLRRKSRAAHGIRRFGPPAAALILLGLYGTSEKSDVLGHLLGWACGMLAGLWVLPRTIPTRLAGAAMGAVACAIVWAAYVAAVRHAF